MVSRVTGPTILIRALLTLPLYLLSDSMCAGTFYILVIIALDDHIAGSEHAPSGGKPGVPSYCILPLFHEPSSADSVQQKQGYISRDGHQFMCKNPATRQQPFHMYVLVTEL